MKKLWRMLTVFLLAFLLAGCGAGAPAGPAAQNGANARTEGEAAGGTAEESGKSTESIRESGTDTEESEEDGRQDDITGNEAESGEAGTAEGTEPGEAAGETGSGEAQTGKEGTAEGTEPGGTAGETGSDGGAEAGTLPEDGVYTSREDVALYLHLYGRLPSNFITKKEAEKLGWTGGSLEPYAPGMCIGGNRFGNYEGLLPEKEGRVYTECDIDTLGAEKRGAKRIVFSNDGLIYYTEDHYQSFTLLYGEE